MNWFLNHLDPISKLGALIVFLIGLLHYRNAQKWKRLEFIAQEIKELEAKPRYSNATKMLDFTESTIELQDKRQIKFNEQVLISALPHEDFKSVFTPDEVEIRLCFCDFFDGLDKMQSFVEAKLIEVHNLIPYLPYWFKRFTANTDKMCKSPEFVDTIWTFIDGYEYTGVRKLARDFDLQPPRREAARERLSERLGRSH